MHARRGPPSEHSRPTCSDGRSIIALQKTYRHNTAADSKVRGRKGRRKQGRMEERQAGKDGEGRLSHRDTYSSREHSSSFAPLLLSKYRSLAISPWCVKSWQTPCGQHQTRPGDNQPRTDEQRKQQEHDTIRLLSGCSTSARQRCQQHNCQHRNNSSWSRDRPAPPPTSFRNPPPSRTYLLQDSLSAKNRTDPPSSRSHLLREPIFRNPPPPKESDEPTSRAHLLQEPTFFKNRPLPRTHLPNEPTSLQESNPVAVPPPQEPGALPGDPPPSRTHLLREPSSGTHLHQKNPTNPPQEPTSFKNPPPPRTQLFQESNSYTNPPPRI